MWTPSLFFFLSCIVADKIGVGDTSKRRRRRRKVLLAIWPKNPHKMSGRIGDLSDPPLNIIGTTCKPRRIFFYFRLLFFLNWANFAIFSTLKIGIFFSQHNFQSILSSDPPSSPFHHFCGCRCWFLSACGVGGWRWDLDATKEGGGREEKTSVQAHSEPVAFTRSCLSWWDRGESFVQEAELPLQSISKDVTKRALGAELPLYVDSSLKVWGRALWQPLKSVGPCFFMTSWLLHGNLTTGAPTRTTTRQLKDGDARSKEWHTLTFATCVVVPFWSSSARHPKKSCHIIPFFWVSFFWNMTGVCTFLAERFVRIHRLVKIFFGPNLSKKETEKFLKCFLINVLLDSSCHIRRVSPIYLFFSSVASIRLARFPRKKIVHGLAGHKLRSFWTDKVRKKIHSLFSSFSHIFCSSSSVENCSQT